MKAAVYTQFGGPIEVQHVDKPTVPDHGALIRVQASGICRSDWYGWQGNDKDIALPHVPGHEFAGIIEEVGSSVIKWEPGTRVTTPFVCGCGNCSECGSRQTQVCLNQSQPGFTHWGSFAEYVVVQHADLNLIKIPESLSFVEAAILGCRFATAYRAVRQQADLQSGQTLIVFGCGGVGFSAIAVAKAIGADVIAVDINPAKLQKAQTLGATYCINTTEEEYSPDAIRALTNGGAHAAIDALGKSELLGLGILSLRPRGIHVQVGLIHENPVPPVPIGRIISAELEIKGSHGLSTFDYEEMLEFISDKNINLKSLITDVVPLNIGIDILKKMDTNPPLCISVIEF